MARWLPVAKPSGLTGPLSPNVFTVSIILRQVERATDILQNSVIWDVTPCVFCKNRQVPTKRRFLQEPHSKASQEKFFVVTAAKTLNLIEIFPFTQLVRYEIWIYRVSIAFGKKEEINV
jgi:hypothetical protein